MYKTNKKNIDGIFDFAISIVLVAIILLSLTMSYAGYELPFSYGSNTIGRVVAHADLSIGISLFILFSITLLVTNTYYRVLGATLGIIYSILSLASYWYFDPVVGFCLLFTGFKLLNRHIFTKEAVNT